VLCDDDARRATLAAATLERLGYFVADSGDHQPESPVLNRTVSLRDTWARIAKRGG